MRPPEQECRLEVVAVQRRAGGEAQQRVTDLGAEADLGEGRTRLVEAAPGGAGVALAVRDLPEVDQPMPSKLRSAR